MLRIAAFASLLLLVALPARAEEIHSGNWEFTTRIQIAGMPQLPPGVKLPGNMTRTHTRCVTPDTLIPSDPKNNCTVEKNERVGNTINWAGTCTTQRGQAHAEGAATYSGETMVADVKMHIQAATGGPPMDMSSHITGRYLGACPAN